MRPLRSWTERALFPSSVEKAAICSAEAVMGVSKTNQVTFSVHGGAVAEPSYWWNDRVVGSNE